MHTHACTHALVDCLLISLKDSCCLFTLSTNMSLHYGPGAAVGPGHMVKKVEESVPMENFAQRKHYLILERPRGTWTPLQIWGLAIDLNFGTRILHVGSHYLVLRREENLHWFLSLFIPSPPVFTRNNYVKCTIVCAIKKMLSRSLFLCVILFHLIRFMCQLYFLMYY